MRKLKIMAAFFLLTFFLTSMGAYCSGGNDFVPIIAAQDSPKGGLDKELINVLHLTAEQINKIQVLEKQSADKANVLLKRFEEQVAQVLTDERQKRLWRDFIQAEKKDLQDISVLGDQAAESRYFSEQQQRRSHLRDSMALTASQQTSLSKIENNFYDGMSMLFESSGQSFLQLLTPEQQSAFQTYTEEKNIQAYYAASPFAQLNLTGKQALQMWEIMEDARLRELELLRSVDGKIKHLLNDTQHQQWSAFEAELQNVKAHWAEMNNEEKRRYAAERQKKSDALHSDLNLTDNQKIMIGEIDQKLRYDVEKLRTSARGKIMNILTPTQQKEFEKIPSKSYFP